MSIIVLYNAIMATFCFTVTVILIPLFKIGTALKYLQGLFLTTGIYFAGLCFANGMIVAHVGALVSITMLWIYVVRASDHHTSPMETCIWFAPALLLLGFELCAAIFKVDASVISESIYRIAIMLEALALIAYSIILNARFKQLLLKIYIYILALAVTLIVLNLLFILNIDTSGTLFRAGMITGYFVLLFCLIMLAINSIYSSGYMVEHTAEEHSSANGSKAKQKASESKQEKAFWQKKPAEPGSLQEAFEELLITQEYYLRPGITLIEMAKEIKSNKTYLSKMVNTTYEMSFSDLLNGLRIDYAKKYLINNRNAKQEEIALACGFPTASAFNYSFKKEVGVTPKIWLATQPDNAL